MAEDLHKTVDRFREVLRATGFGDLVDSETVDADRTDRSPAQSLGELVTAVREGVVPAMLAHAEAARLLPNLETDDSDAELPLEDPRATRIMLGAPHASDRADEAARLDRLLVALAGSVNADRS